MKHLCSGRFFYRLSCYAEDIQWRFFLYSKIVYCCGRSIKKIIRKFQFLFFTWCVILDAVLEMRRKTDEK